MIIKIKNRSADTALSFSNIIRRDKRNLEKMRADTNSQLKNFCNQRNIHLILNANINKEHLDIKKLHLNRKGNSIFAKNLLNTQSVFTCSKLTIESLEQGVEYVHS